MTTISALQSQIDKLARRVLMIAAPGQITATDDKDAIHKIQLRINGTPETIDDVGVMQIYGIASHAPAGTDCTALFINGMRSNPVVIATGNQKARVRELKPGEITFYTDEGDRIDMARDNQIKITAKQSATIDTKTATVKGSDKVELDAPTTSVSRDLEVKRNIDADGNMTAKGSIDASGGFFQNGQPIGGGGPGGGNGGGNGGGAPPFTGGTIDHLRIHADPAWLELSNPAVAGYPLNGGIWRITSSSGGNLNFFVNDSSAGDFGALRQALRFSPAGELAEHAWYSIFDRGINVVGKVETIGAGGPNANSPFPQLVLSNTSVPGHPLAGGRWRIAVGNNGQIGLQYNTSGSGDFGSLTQLLMLDPATGEARFSGGQVRFDQGWSSDTGVNVTGDINLTGNVYRQGVAIPQQGPAGERGQDGAPGQAGQAGQTGPAGPAWNGGTVGNVLVQVPSTTPATGLLEVRGSGSPSQADGPFPQLVLANTSVPSYPLNGRWRWVVGNNGQCALQINTSGNGSFSGISQHFTVNPLDIRGGRCEFAFGLSTPGQIVIDEGNSNASLVIGSRIAGYGEWYIYANTGYLRFYSNGADRLIIPDWLGGITTMTGRVDINGELWVNGNRIA